MTKNTRILVNVLATYGRNVYATLLGLFSSRWALMSLGQIDYGLYGVICGMTVFISVTNSLLAHVVSRYYALCIGKASVINEEVNGLEECRRWFSIATVIHTIVPVVLILIGYPIGVWAIMNFLSIPDDRVSACIWAFRFVCVTSFVSMITVPFVAMYRAKQLIAELTLYSVATSTLNIVLLYYMVTHPGDWLARYAAGTCVFAVLPQTIIMARALFIFDECKFRIAYCVDSQRILKFLHFTSWQAFGIFGGMLRSPGVALIINKYYGPQVNAAMTIANSVNGHANSLSGSLINAFTPEIVTAKGANDNIRMTSMAYMSCKFGMLLALIFVIPLAVELKYVMQLWLKNPPEYAVGLCWCIMLSFLIDKSSVGQMIAVNAQDRIALYQAVLGSSLLLTIPISWFLVSRGYGVYSVGYAFMLTTAATAWGRVWFARKLVNMSVRFWLFRIFLPIVAIAIISFVCGMIVRFSMPDSIGRLMLTVTVCEIFLIALAWPFVLSHTERQVVIMKIRTICRRIGER